MKVTLACLLLMVGQAACAQRVQVGTNTVGLMCLGTMNLGMDFGIAQHWSLGVQGKYNPFSYQMGGGETGRMQLRQRSVAAGARWWPWHIYSGWWVYGKAQWQEYNMGGIVSDKTEEGQRYGGGLSAGYTHMISAHFNLEMGLGFWGGMKRYIVYACPTCGTKIDSGTKTFIMPNDLILALSYVF